METEVIDATFVEPEVIPAGQAADTGSLVDGSSRGLSPAEQRLANRIALVGVVGFGLGALLGYRLLTRKDR